MESDKHRLAHRVCVARKVHGNERCRALALTRRVVLEISGKIDSPIVFPMLAGLSVVRNSRFELRVQCIVPHDGMRTDPHGEIISADRGLGR